MRSCSCFGLPVEFAEWHRAVLEFVGASSLRRVDRGWSVRAGMGEGAGRLRRVCRHRLELAVDGRRDDESATRREKKTGPNPTDRGKLGTKRSLLTEGNGIPIGVAVDGANRVDFKMLRETVESIPVERPEPTRRSPQGLCLDK